MSRPCTAADVRKIASLLKEGRWDEAVTLCDEFEWISVEEEDLLRAFNIGDAIMKYEAIDESTGKSND